MTDIKAAILKVRAEKSATLRLGVPLPTTCMGLTRQPGSGDTVLILVLVFEYLSACHVLSYEAKIMNLDHIIHPLDPEKTCSAHLAFLLEMFVLLVPVESDSDQHLQLQSYPFLLLLLLCRCQDHNTSTSNYLLLINTTHSIKFYSYCQKR